MREIEINILRQVAADLGADLSHVTTGEQQEGAFLNQAIRSAAADDPDRLVSINGRRWTAYQVWQAAADPEAGVTSLALAV